ncbi:MAG: hypothetical protein ABID04_02865 [Patescibacteria group bacterium]
MKKGIFVLEKLNLKKAKQVLNLGCNTVFVGHQNLDRNSVDFLKKAGVEINVEFGVFAGQEWWQKYPDSRPVDMNGKLMDPIHWYAGVCPNHPGVVKDKLGSIKKVLLDYSIDGLWLDFIRYPCHWEDVRDSGIIEYCFCQNCLKKFGKNPAGPNWINWKCQQITNFLKQTKKLLSKKTKLGIFTVPWRSSDFNNAITRVIGQDLPALAKHVDTFSPMTYHQMVSRSIDWIAEIVNYTDKETKKLVLPLVQTEDKPNRLSAEEFKFSIEQAIKTPSEGVIVFFLEDLLKDPKKTTVVKSVFR